MNILGITGGSSHDGSASIVSDNRVINVIEQERISRNKHAPNELPIAAAREAIYRAGLKPKDIDVVSFFIDPNKFNREVMRHVFLDDWKRYALRPNSYKTIKFLQRGQRYKRKLELILREIEVVAPVEYVEHHIAHAASCFYLSPFEEAMIVTLDNMGELDSTLMAVGKGTTIEVLKRQRIPHSLGMFFGAMTNYLGFKAWEEEGKVMALAAYGTPTIPLEEMIELDDGSFRFKKDFQMIQTVKGDRLFSKRLVKKYGEPRKSGGTIQKAHMDFAASVQSALEKVAQHLVTWLYEKTGIPYLCLSGGVALNCKMNSELKRLPFVQEVYVTPVAGDAGTSLGAAIYSATKRSKKRPEPLLNAYLGREFSQEEIRKALDDEKMSYQRCDDSIAVACNILLKEKIIAFFQGRAEIGPRALGHRSILALPQDVAIKDYINSKIKNREMWRPLCPSVTEDAAERYFVAGRNSRFMNIAHHATQLAIDHIPGVIHVDGTARVQSVSPEEERNYYRLLELVGKENGHPVLLNTSFNSRGEPIVDSPYDAIRCFKKMPLRSMIMGDYLVRK